MRVTAVVALVATVSACGSTAEAAPREILAGCAGFAADYRTASAAADAENRKVLMTDLAHPWRVSDEWTGAATAHMRRLALDVQNAQVSGKWIQIQRDYLDQVGAIGRVDQGAAGKNNHLHDLNALCAPILESQARA